MKKRKLELSDDVVLHLKQMREALAGVKIGSTGGTSVTQEDGGCGGTCMITCSYYCENSCADQCDLSCDATCEGGSYRESCFVFLWVMWY